MKERSNIFRFSLHQDNILFCEKMFDADQFNPFTRYSINIRDVLPKITNDLQRTLSKDSYITKNYYTNYTKQLNKYDKKIRNTMYYNPPVNVREIDGRTMKGVEFKLGFYINDNPIVERMFFVDGFNPISRWSLDIVRAVSYACDDIEENIRQTDIKNMWDDYDLINKMGLSIAKIRELSPQERSRLLYRIHNKKR